MNLFDITYYGAFGAGITSFLSPCLLPIIPMFLAYLAGSEKDKNKKNVITKTLAFILGFTLIFVLLGTSAGFLGDLLRSNKEVLTRVSGLIFIIFALKLLDVIKLKKIKAGKISMNKRNDNLGAFIMGITFAIGWTPCFGPILAAILVIAGQTTTALKGGNLLMIYSIGMAIPFFIAALFYDKVSAVKLFRSISGKVVHRLVALLMMAYGLLAISNQLTLFNYIF